MFKELRENQRGMAMPSVLMISLILMILSLTVLMVVTADYRHGTYQKHKLQAHYLAKSAAQTMAQYLIDQAYDISFEEMEDLLTSISNQTSEETIFQGGTFTLQTKTKTVGGQEKIEIISKGNYQGVSDTISVTLNIFKEEGDSSYNPTLLENALIALSEDAENRLELTSGAFLEGDVVVNATEVDAIRFSGGGFHIRKGALYIPYDSDPQEVIATDKGASNGDAPIEYQKEDEPDWKYIPDWAFWKDIEDGVKFITMPTYPSATLPKPTFPDFPAVNELPVPENLEYETPWVNGTYYPITEDGYYTSIRPSSGRTITVDLAEGDRIIRVGNLDLTGGNIELIHAAEDSRLIFYVDERFSLSSSWSLNRGGVPDHVQIYYAGNHTITLDGAARFAGNIFIKEADLNLTAGANMIGNVVTLGDKVTVSGGASAQGMVLYAPDSLVEMSGSGQIKGAVVANRFKRSGGGNAGIIYTESPYDIPGDFFKGEDKNIVISYDKEAWKEYQ